MPTSAPSGTTLRPATAADLESIASLWHRGWPDGHRGHVPAELEQHRRLADFRNLVSSRIDRTIVADADSRVVGFVTVHDDEIEQIYVDAQARGGGAAAALLERGEELIAARFEVAWLAVVAGNERARRFYTRQGWRDAGPFDYAAEIASGRTPVPCHRYEKRVEVRP